MLYRTFIRLLWDAHDDDDDDDDDDEIITVITLLTMTTTATMASSMMAATQMTKNMTVTMMRMMTKTARNMTTDEASARLHTKTERCPSKTLCHLLLTDPAHE